MAKQRTDFNRLARKFKALAHPARLKIAAGLLEGECCAGKIGKCVSLSQPHASQSLRILRNAGIVSSRKEKTQVCYRIADKEMGRVLKRLLKGDGR